MLRKLETHFPGKIETRYVMGGLVENARTFGDSVNGIGGPDMHAFNRQVAAHWADASRRHGMPVDADNYELFDDENRSTYPINIAYKAAQIADPDKADLFLYNLRAASAAEARKTNREDVLVSVASESRLDIAAFLKALHDGSAQEAFDADLEYTRAMGVQGFPTFLVQAGDKKYMLRGYNSFDTFATVIESATGGDIRPVAVEASPEALLAFMQNGHPRMTAEEIRQAFDLDTAEDARKLAQSNKWSASWRLSGKRIPFMGSHRWTLR